MDIRNARILEGINVAKGRGLEIGPLTSPILSKAEADIYYLDHMSTEELKEKYKKEPVELDKIVDVDYVVRNNSVKKTVKEQKFDYVIASHVIEHIPDMVRWLQDIGEVLHPGGKVSLIIPDKRFTFDINRRVSLPAEVIGAYLDAYTRFSSAMMYDFASECMVEVETTEAWKDPEQYITAPRRWSKEVIMDKCMRNIQGEYVDCHCYVFTPASFIVILEALMQHGLLNYQVVHFLETQKDEIEFYVTLQKIDPKKFSLKKQLASLPVVPPEPNKLIGQIRDLEEQVVILKQDLEAITGSFSWRATKGLRTVRKKVGRKRHEK